MPPDIIAGPMAAAGTPPGRASGPMAAAGPPGSDPLAALFAALLVQSGASPTTGAAIPLLKAAPKPNMTAESNGKTAAPAKNDTQDKTQEKTPNAALPILPPLPIIPISMRPILPPTAGVSVGQKTTEKTSEKTMDTSPAPAFPEKEKASAKPGGELPLQEAGITSPGASALFPALLIASPAFTSPASPVTPSLDRAAALPAVPGAAASAPSLTVIEPRLPSLTPIATPKVFALEMAAVPAAAPASLTTEKAPQNSPTGRVTAPPQPTPAGYVPQPQGLPVPVDTVLKLMKMVPETPPVPVPATAEGVASALPQAMLAAAVQMAAPGEAQQEALPGAQAAAPGMAQAAFAAPLWAGQLGMTATKELTVTDGKTATDSTLATVGKIATVGKSAMEGEPTTDGRAATEGRTATEGQTLTAGGGPEKALKSAALPADTNTRSEAAPAKILPAGLGFQAIGKRSERRAESADADALPALPNPVPAQAGAERTEAKPLTAADRAEMVRQVADGVAAMPLPAKPGASEQMTLQLHPKDWGQLQVSVTITPGSHPNAVQAVTAHIVAQSPQVKAALENGSSDLRQALRQAGLHLDRISVTVQRMEAGAQAGTTTSGGRHEASQGGAGQGMGGAFGDTTPNQKTGMSDGAGMPGGTGNGMPSFTASGGSHGGRQGGEPPPTYAAAYAPAEPEDVLPESPRRLATGQVDIRA